MKNTVQFEITDQTLIEKAKKMKGRKWRQWLTDSITSHARAAVGLNADVSLKEAAATLGCSYRTVKRWKADGAFPNAWGSTGAVRVPLADIEEYKKSRQFIIT